MVAKFMKSNPFYKKSRRRSGRSKIATVAYYGPSSIKATKLVVSIMNGEEFVDMKKWIDSSMDIRINPRINQEATAYISGHGPLDVVLADRIMGCIHEEGHDYPTGEVCQVCEYWIDKDRFSDVDNPPFM